MIGKPRGTRDFLPSEMKKRRMVEGMMRKVFEKYGYEEVATPTIENLELFTLKSGEQIMDEIYAFEDKSGRKIALRPELTAPVIRMYVEKLQMETKPLKFYYFGNCFRYDRPQKGRYREFWQFGCELIGTNRPEAIAELIAMAYDILKTIGLKNVVLRVGNLDILRRFLDTIGANDAEMMRLIDKKDFESIERRLGKEEFEKFMDFIEIKNIDEVKFEEAEKMKEMLSFLEEFSVPFNLDLSIARGLDYYIGTVFEIDAPKLGAEKQLCGGGEYNLITILGGRHVPTSGFAIGFDRAILALETEGHVFDIEEDKFYVAHMDMAREAIKVARMLRKEGFKVEMDIMGRSIKKSLDYANRRGISKVIIVAPEEWEKEEVLVKDMKTGEQNNVKVNELINKLYS